jgi:hypothetical protein
MTSIDPSAHPEGHTSCSHKLPPPQAIVDYPMFLVHEIVAALWDSGMDRFSKTCFGSGGLPDLRAFWDHVSGEDWFKNHPVRDDGDRLAYSIPCSMFGDDARLYKVRL